MASVSVRVAALPNLIPGNRSLTTGGPGGDVVTVRALRSSGNPLAPTHLITLRIDHTSARRFRLFDRYHRVHFPVTVLVVAAMAWAVVMSEFDWAWVVLGASVAVSLLGRVLRPRAYPAIDPGGATIRLDHLDEEAASEWLAVNDNASITVIPTSGSGRRRPFLFGTKPMFFALLAYTFLCMLTAGLVFQPETRTVPVQREVFTWSADDSPDETTKSVLIDGNATLTVKCSGGGRMRLTSVSAVREPRQIADISCDGVPTSMTYTQVQTIADVIARDQTGVVTGWRVTMTQPGVEETTIPKHVARWLVVLPISLTIVLAWVPFEAFAMIRHWRAIPLERRPHTFNLVPEFSHLDYQGMMTCVVGLLAATVMNAAVWFLWAQTV